MPDRLTLVLATLCAVALVAVIVAAVRADDHEGQHCTLWQPVLVGKTTTIMCTRWEDR